MAPRAKQERNKKKYERKMKSNQHAKRMGKSRRINVQEFSAFALLKIVLKLHKNTKENV